MIYVYCDRASNGAKDLVEKLRAERVRRFDGMDIWVRGKKIHPRPEDLVVCWGRPLPPMEGVTILNAGPKVNKIDDTRNLTNAGVPTIQTSPYPSRGFVKRLKFHVGGNDLLNPPETPDFWVRKYDFVDEYRVHSFDGRAIKSGKKVPRAGFTVAASEAEWAERKARGEQVAHPWIKSYDGGWMVNYVGFHSDKPLRKVAHKAVEALGLTFGAVDIGDTGPNSDMNRYLVLEVNRAPGMEGTTIDAYVRSINRWMGQEDEPKVEEPAEEEAAPARRGGHPLASRVQRAQQEADQERQQAQYRRLVDGPPIGVPLNNRGVPVRNVAAAPRRRNLGDYVIEPLTPERFQVAAPPPVEPEPQAVWHVPPQPDYPAAPPNQLANFEGLYQHYVQLLGNE